MDSNEDFNNNALNANSENVDILDDDYEENTEFDDSLTESDIETEINDDDTLVDDIDSTSGSEGLDTIENINTFESSNDIDLEDDDLSQNLGSGQDKTQSIRDEKPYESHSKDDWDAGGYEQEELADALKMVEDFSSLLALKDALQKDLLDTKDSFKKSLRINVELNDRVKKLEEYARLTEELRRDLSFVEEERNDALKNVQDLDFELKSLKNVSQKLSKDLEERDDLESTLLNLQERTALLEREKSAQIETLEHQLSELKKNTDKAEDELAVIMEEHEALKSSYETVNIEFKTSQSLIKQLTYEKEHLQNRIKFFEKDKATTDSKITQTSRKARNSENENFLLQKYVSELRKELSDTKSTKDKLNKELDVARKSFLELKDKLVNVMGSKEISGVV